MSDVVEHHFISSSSQKYAAKNPFSNFHCLCQNRSHYSPEPKTRGVHNFGPVCLLPPPVVKHHMRPCHMCWVLYPTVSG